MLTVTAFAALVHYVIEVSSYRFCTFHFLNFFTFLFGKRRQIGRQVGKELGRIVCFIIAIGFR